MTCKICGRPSPAGAKLCPDCRAARKRAYDATITQPLWALAGAGPVSRTLSRLRRGDASPEAKARRAARKAQAAAPDPAAPAATPAEAPRSKRPLLLALLAIGVALAAVAGWHMPSRAPDQSESLTAPPGISQAPAQNASDSGAGPGGLPSAETPPPTATLAPLPTIVERELVPYSPAPAKPPASKRVIAPPKAAAPSPEAPPEVEVVRALPAPVAAPHHPVRRIDPWQQMAEAIGRCPSGFLDHVLCEQRVRLQYCDGHWGQVTQCPGGPSVDHN
jgi:hypothetical protein